MNNERIPFPQSTSYLWTNNVGRSGSGAAASVAVGKVVKIHGLFFGVALATIAASAEGVVKTAGVFEIPKTTGALTRGQRVGYDFTNDYVQADLTGGCVGRVWKDAASGDTTVWVELNAPPKRIVQSQRATTGTEQSNNYIDVDLGFPAANAIVVAANLHNSSRVRRAFTSYTKNPGGSAANTMRLSETDIASGDTAEYIIEEAVGS